MTVHQRQPRAPAPVPLQPVDMTCEQWAAYVQCDNRISCNGPIKTCRCANGESISYTGNLANGPANCDENGNFAPYPFFNDGGSRW